MTELEKQKIKDAIRKVRRSDCYAVEHLERLEEELGL